MRWYRNCSRRRLKKWFGGRRHCVDGVYYKLDCYGQLLRMFSRLQLGDMMFVNYPDVLGGREPAGWLPITALKPCWEPIGPPRCGATWIDDFHIQIDNRWLLYDLDICQAWARDGVSPDGTRHRDAVHYPALLERVGVADAVEVYGTQVLDHA